MPPASIAAEPADLDLLREWREPVWPGRFLRAGAGSIAVHAVVIAVLLSVRGTAPITKTPVVTVDLRKSVKLVAPKFYEPTQKEPTKGKVTRQLDVRSAVAATRSQAPRFRAPARPPGPIAQTPAPPPSIEPPAIEVPAAAPPPVVGTIPQLQAPPPKEKPKLAFESVGSGARATPNPNVQIPLPKTSVQDAVRGAATQPAGGGGIAVGDIGDDFTTLPGLNQNEPPGRVGSNLQLLSDPKGVDFKPYLIQVLAAVRRNWLAIIPESARMGRRGRVLVQFIIDRKGGVPKLVIAEASGTEAFDRAAVAGISASYPFPALPPDYKGDQIRLQLAFSYNVPR
jgi:TonB family protein